MVKCLYTENCKTSSKGNEYTNNKNIVSTLIEKNV